MTWKEFKEAVEANGVTDEMVVAWIDVHCPSAEYLQVAIETVTVGVLTANPETETQFTVS